MKYQYRGIVTSVYDGDTLNVDIDLGFNVWLKNQTIRLSGIDTPEIKGKTKNEGIKSRDRLRELVLNKEILLETIKDKKEKYGRWLGELTFDGKNINNLLLEENLATYYVG